MRYLLVLLVLIVLLVPTVAGAQELTPAPSPEATASPLSNVLAWLAVVAGVWGVWSASVMVGLDALKGRIMAFVKLAGFEDVPAIRGLITIAAVFFASFQLVQSGDYNIFTLENAPSLISNVDLQQFITVVFMASGAIALHDVLKFRGKVALWDKIVRFADDLELEFVSDNETSA